MTLDIDPRDFDSSAAAAAQRFVSVSEELRDRSYWPLKIFANANLFLWHLDAFARPDHPVPLFVDAFSRATRFLDIVGRSGLCRNPFPPDTAVTEDPDQLTGPLFGAIYAPLSDKEFFDEAYVTLRQRLERNDVDPVRLFSGRVVLDAGCGIGKYSTAMARLGAAKVIGIDLTETAIRKAQDQAKKTQFSSQLDFKVGSITDIPLPDRCVDVAWANSVLHLVDKPERGIAELARVLKPGGTAFIYVNGRFGLLELLVRSLYAANHGIPRSLFQHTLALTGMRPGRVAWIVGFTCANYRFMSRAETERIIVRNGFSITKRLTRGIETDQIEQVSAGLPFGNIKYGEAKLNYLLRRQ